MPRPNSLLMSLPTSKLSVREQAQLKHLLDKAGGVDSLVQSIQDLDIDDEKCTFGYGYMRVSDPTKEDPESLKTQEKIIKKFAKDKNVKLIEILKDVGVSGSLSPGERPGFSQILWNLQPGQCIIAAATDRFFRPEESDRKTILIFLKKKECTLMAPDYVPDDDSKPEIAFTQTVYAAAHKLQRDLSIKKTTDAMRRKSREGTLGCRPNYGWKSPGKGLEWIPIEYEQNAIKKIEEIKRADMKILNSELIEKLKTSGFPYAKEYYNEDGTLKKKSNWSYNTIQIILVRLGLVGPKIPI